MGFLLPEFRHIVNNRLKYIYLTFDEEANLVIKSPRITQAELEKVLIKKSAWIEKSRRKVLSRKGVISPVEGKQQVYFLGEAHEVRHELGERGRAVLEFGSGGFVYRAASFDLEEFRSVLDRFYLREARESIPRMLRDCSERSGLEPGKLSLRKAAKRWGSCSSRNDISINYRVMKLPPELIEYILYHELAHICHKNHKKEFWALVGELMPHYRDCEVQLKTYRP